MAAKKRLFRQGIFAVVALSALLSAGFSEAAVPPSAERIPIQHKGRIQPLDAFARQTVKLITGKERFEKTRALSLLLEMMKDPAAIAEKRWIRIDFAPLKEALGLKKENHFFSFNEINPSRGQINRWVRNAKEKRDRDLRPEKIEQKAELLLSRLFTVESLVSGRSLTVLPVEGSPHWASAFMTLDKRGVRFQKMLDLYGEDPEAFAAESERWFNDITAADPSMDPAKLSLEVFYYRLGPFGWAASGYFAAFLLLTLFHRNARLRKTGFAVAVAAIAFHTLGLGLRVFILSRPPVSNMYESMIFMNWALIACAVVFTALRRNLLPVKTGCALSGMVMVYAGLLPIDSSLDVLVPVLRSNYWLTIHVMTIVSSYGAFGLAMALGHRHLYCAVFNKFKGGEEAESAHLMTRVIQLGVILIGTGTVLGGVWANESWGRFWGWDPKETWALITFLGYLIVVHLRFLKRMDNFSLALASVLGFLLVLMTWYGVNFVLGRGLHSYGQGSGGMEWILYYLVFEALFVGWALLKKPR